MPVWGRETRISGRNRPSYYRAVALFPRSSDNISWWLGARHALAERDWIISSSKMEEANITKYRPFVCLDTHAIVVMQPHVTRLWLGCDLHNESRTAKCVLQVLYTNVSTLCWLICSPPLSHTGQVEGSGGGEREDVLRGQNQLHGGTDEWIQPQQPRKHHTTNR